MTEAELDRRLFNGEAVEAALELFAENQRLLSSEPSEGERETRRRVAGAAFDMGASIADKRDAEIAALREEARADNADAIEAAVLAQDEIAALKAEVVKLRAALAAGPAALRALRSDDYSPGYVAGVVEDAQEAAMKEGT